LNWINATPKWPRALDGHQAIAARSQCRELSRTGSGLQNLQDSLAYAFLPNQ
jgi:hypothetical protein